MIDDAHKKDEWPSFAQELSRKAAEQLEWVLQRYEQKEISRREAYIAAGMIWSITSGMIEENVGKLVAEVQREIRNDKG